MNDKYVCIYICQCIYLYAHSLITHGKPIRLSLVIHTPRDRHEVLMQPLTICDLKWETTRSTQRC